MRRRHVLFFYAEAGFTVMFSVCGLSGDAKAKDADIISKCQRSC